MCLTLYEQNSFSLILELVASDRLQIYVPSYIWLKYHRLWRQTTNKQKKTKKPQIRLITNQLQKDVFFYHSFLLIKHD